MTSSKRRSIACGFVVRPATQSPRTRTRLMAVAAIGALTLSLDIGSAAAAPKRRPPATADLSVGVTDTEDPYVVAWTATDEGAAYTATVSNAGPSESSGVVLTFSTPGGKPADPPGCATSYNNDIGAWSASCPLGALAPGSTVTKTIRVQWSICDDGSTVFADVRSNTNDPVSTNNTDAETTDVVFLDAALYVCTA